MTLPESAAGHDCGLSGTDDRLGLRVIGGDVSAPLAQALASVPELFRLTDDTSQTDVSWVRPSSSWAETARQELDRGARTVLVEVPDAPSPAQIAQLSGRPVGLITARSYAPQLTRLRALIEPLRNGLTWVEVLVVDDAQGSFDPRRALWDAASLLPVSGLGIDSVPVAACLDGVVIADAGFGDAQVHITSVRRRGLRPRASIKVFGTDGSAQMVAGAPEIAWPGEVLTIGGDEASLAATVYETPTNHALRDVHAYLTGASPCLRSAIDIFAPVSGLLNQVDWRESCSAKQQE